MKQLCTILLIVCGATTASTAEAPKDTPPGIPTSRAVLAPSKRLDALKLASRVLEPRQPTWKVVLADLPDPFYRTNFSKEPEPQVAVVPQQRREDSDILELAVADLRPTGTLQMGSENYLLVGGKRFRKGDVFPVTIDGIVYKITLSIIERNAYTLRLNETDLRRQLK